MWWLFVAIVLGAVALMYFAKGKGKPAPAPPSDGAVSFVEIPYATLGDRRAPALGSARVTWTMDKPFTGLFVGDVAKITITVDGKPMTGGTVQWAQNAPLVKCAPLVPVTTPGQVGTLTAIAAGQMDIFCIVNGLFSAITHLVISPAVVVTVPVAPAKAWKRNRPHITMVSTNFYYNWLPSMYAVYAKLYDVVYSGTDAVTSALKALNPNLHRLKYALEVTTINTSGGSLETGYLTDYMGWCSANSIDAVSAEAGFLHAPGTSDKVNRIHQSIWNSPRDVPDPTSPVMRRYQVNRLQRVAAAVGVDGAFLDEFGSNPNRGTYALACGGDAVKLQALCDAETTLIALIEKSIAPKQLVLNTASYDFAWDKAISIAAFGTHMEETNNPLVVELANMYWPYIDGLLAAGVFVNMVPPYQWGEYETQHDSPPTKVSIRDEIDRHSARQRERWANHPVRGDSAKTALPPDFAATAPIPGANYMDTHRGKLLEVASYYMVVTDPALCGLSIENGDWAKYTPTQNWMPEIDAAIGTAIETRKAVTTAFVGRGHCYERRFTNGLVVSNMIPDRNPANYGPAGGGTYTLPTDRLYYRVYPNGKAELAPTKSIALRCPEATIFVVTP